MLSRGVLKDMSKGVMKYVAELHNVNVKVGISQLLLVFLIIFKDRVSQVLQL